MSDSIVRLLEELPATNLTTRALDAVDMVTPGTWRNITSFAELVADETGESDDAIIQDVGAKAIALYADESTGYQRAVSLYKLVDSGSTMAGMASLAGKLAEDVSWLSFLDGVTPKPETAQAADAALKLAAEVAAFVSTQGIPGDGVMEFVSSVMQAAKEDKIRLTSWVVYDGILPLGPDFLAAATNAINGGLSSLSESPLYEKIKGLLPGGSEDEHRAHVSNVLNASGGWIGEITSNPAASREGILSRVSGFLDGAEGKLDYAASIVDLSTNIFEHTGIQTVARRCIRRAYAEI
jgi:hypothetical protein